MTYDFDTPVDRQGTGSLKWNKYAGKDILPMWVADMDFVSAPEIIEALHARIDHGVFGYTVPYPEVVDEVVAYQERVHNRAIKAEWIVWLPGLVQGLNLICRLLEKHESVMTLSPVYAPFLNSPEFQGRPLIRVPLDETNAWAIDFDAMEAAVTPETRLFVLCHPHNPVGRVYSTTDLEKIGDFCLRHNLILCADEIHCDLVYGETPFVSTATISKEIEDISMTMMSASKTYNLPGLSCAYMIIPNTALRNRFRRVCRGVITEVNTLGYTGLLAAYKYGEPWRIQLLDYLKGNVDYFYQAVQEQLAPLIMAPMDATYLAWLDARALPVDNPQRFFEEHGVGYSDGYDFYEGYGLDKPPKREKSTHGFIRANLGCPRSMIEETVARTARAIAQL